MQPSRTANPMRKGREIVVQVPNNKPAMKHYVYQNQISNFATFKKEERDFFSTGRYVTIEVDIISICMT